MTRDFNNDIMKKSWGGVDGPGPILDDSGTHGNP